MYTMVNVVYGNYLSMVIVPPLYFAFYGNGRYQKYHYGNGHFQNYLFGNGHYAIGRCT